LTTVEAGFELAPGHAWLDAVADPVRILILRALSETAEATAPDLAKRGQASGAP
jgi:hypothetical protein